MLSIKELQGRRVVYLAKSEFHSGEELLDNTRGTIVHTTPRLLRDERHFGVDWDNGFNYDLYLKNDFTWVLKLLEGKRKSWMDAWTRKASTLHT